MKILSFKRGLEKKRKNGFTLPELLIVMTVVAALASVIMVTFPASQKRARDTRRKSDLKQYQTTIEIYYNKNNSYPTMNGNIASYCGTLGLTTCPDDPQSSVQNYKVVSNATSYTISVKLERPADNTKPYFVICSDGTAAEKASVSCP